ncbi:MAG: NAD(P)-dependent oxidoreductase [Chloroflexota bacterium]|nr:NAD(P)-dependent oxidoreductase [Chloroflexota bacterium]
MKILITGAAGFIGSTLVELLRHEHDIRAIDNFSVGDVRHVGDVTVEEMDVANQEHVEEMVRGQEVVVHLAGFTGIPVCENNPEAAAVNILVATKYVTDAAVRAGVRQLLFPSTFAVYGVPPHHITEETPRAPIGMYGNLRAGAEYILLAAQQLDGLGALIFRQSNIYGRGIAKKRSLLNILTDQVLRREPITMYGSGEQVRNFLHVRDTVQAYKLAIEKGATGIYNLGSAETLSVRTIIETVNEASQRLFGYTVPVERKPDRGAAGREVDLTDFHFDISKVQRELGFQPKLKVRDAVEELLAQESSVPAT